MPDAVDEFLAKHAKGGDPVDSFLSKYGTKAAPAAAPPPPPDPVSVGLGSVKPDWTFAPDSASKEPNGLGIDAEAWKAAAVTAPRRDVLRAVVGEVPETRPDAHPADVDAAIVAEAVKHNPRMKSAPGGVPTPEWAESVLRAKVSEDADVARGLAESEKGKLALANLLSAPLAGATGGYLDASRGGGPEATAAAREQLARSPGLAFARSGLEMAGAALPIAGAGKVLGAVGAGRAAVPLAVGAYNAAHEGAGDTADRFGAFIQGTAFASVAGALTERTQAALMALPATQRVVALSRALGSRGPGIVTKGVQGVSGAVGGYGGQVLTGGGTDPNGAVLLSVLSMMEPNPRAAMLAELRGQKIAKESARDIRGENDLLAGSIPTEGVTPHDTLRAATAQAEAIHDAAGTAADAARVENREAIKRRRGVDAFAARMVEQGVGSTEQGPTLSTIIRQRFPDATRAEIDDTILSLHDKGAIDADRAARELGLQWTAAGRRHSRGAGGAKQPYTPYEGKPPQETPRLPPPWEQVVERPIVLRDPAYAANKAAAEAADSIPVPYPAETAGRTAVGAPAVESATSRAAEPSSEPPNAPLRPVGGVTASEVAADAARTGQRGAVAANESPGPSAKERIAQLWETAKKDGGAFLRWWGSRILAPAFQRDPETAALMARAAGRQQMAHDAATVIEESTLKGWNKADRNRFDLAYTESQLRPTGATLRGKGKAFDAAFPTEQAFDEFVNSPRYQDAVRARDEIRKTRKFGGYTHEELNVRGGGLDPDAMKARGLHGEFSNMIPLTADDVEAIQAGRRSGTLAGTPRSLVGPRISRSPVAKQFTGMADAYDYSVRNQDARAMARSGEAADSLDIVDSMLRNKSAIDAEDASGKPVEKPAGMTYMDLPLGKGLRVNGEGGRRGLYVADELVSPLRAIFRQGFTNEEAGLGLKAKAKGTAAVLVGPVDAVGHIGFNVLPAVAMTAKNPLRVMTRTVELLRDPAKLAEARIAQAEEGGVKNEYHRVGTGWIAKASGGVGRLLESFDAAARESTLDAVEARAQKQGRKATTREKHEALLGYGQYQTAIQDTITKSIRTFSSPFVVIGKAGVSNAFRTATLGQARGYETHGARLRAAARYGAVWAAYLTYVGLKNYDKTGTWFPKDVPFGAQYEGIDGKTGKAEYSWGLAVPLGIYQALNWTPLGGAIDATRRGESAGAVAAESASRPVGRVARVFGYWPLTLDKMRENLSRGDLGKAATEALPVVKSAIDLVHSADGEGDDNAAASVLTPMRKQKGLSPSELSRVGAR